MLTLFRIAGLFIIFGSPSSSHAQAIHQAHLLANPYGSVEKGSTWLSQLDSRLRKLLLQNFQELPPELQQRTLNRLPFRYRAEIEQTIAWAAREPKNLKNPAAEPPPKGIRHPSQSTNSMISPVWSAQYNGPGISRDEVENISVDHYGNTYVITHSTFQSPWSHDSSSLLKYSSTGIFQWAIHTNWRPMALALDSLGDIFLAENTMIWAYDAGGNWLWKQGTGLGAGGYYALAVDQAGNIYASGCQRDTTPYYQFETTKFDRFGNMIWNRIYSIEEGEDAEGDALTLDDSANVYVSGAYGEGAATLKYDSSGTLIWAQVSGLRYPGSIVVDKTKRVYVATLGSNSIVCYGPGGDSAWAVSDPSDLLILDDSGGVYCTERRSNRGIEKYDTSGIMLWSTQPVPGTDLYDLARDAHNNIIAVGTNGSQCVIAKLYPTGDTTWTRYYSDPQWPSAVGQHLAVGPGGSISVGAAVGIGYLLIDRESNVATLGYSSGGNRLWTVGFDAAKGQSDDLAWAVAVDTSGSTYVTGSSISVTGEDAFTIKYNLRGDSLWCARAPYGPGADIMVDDSGNAYVITQQGWLIKYGFNGTLRWQKQLGTSGLRVAKALDGSIIAIGGTSQGYGTMDFAIAQYTPGGATMWTAQYDGPAHANDYVCGFAQDSSADILVCGQSYNAMSQSSDAVTLKLSSRGVLQWIRRYNDGANGENYANAVATDRRGNIYTAVIGTSSSFVLKYDSSGSTVWSRQFPWNAIFDAMAVDPHEDVYIHEKGSPLIKLDSSGSVYNYSSVWSGGHTLLMDQWGNLYALMVKYNPDLRTVWNLQAPGDLVSSIANIALDKHCNVHATGSVLTPNEGYNFLTTVYAQRSAITGTLFDDFNGNGVRDLGESGLVGWKIYVNGTIVDSTVTNSNGAYEFDLMPGMYTVSLEARSGWVTTVPHPSGTYTIALDYPIDTASLDFGNCYRCFSVTISGTHAAGWNMLSLPVAPVDNRTASLFPTATGQAFTYQSLYIAKDTLQPGIGYWLKFPTADTASVTGIQLFFDTVSVSQGWNMVGSLAAPVGASSVTSDPPGIKTSQFFGYRGTYFGCDTLIPGKGYWIKASQPGRLIFSALSGPDAAARIKITPTSELPPPDPSGHAVVADLPREFALDEAYPSPFNPVTTIRYQLPEPSSVTLKIYNLLGQVIETLKDGIEDAGYKSILWNASNFASGIYFYRLEATSIIDPSKTITQVRKALLLK